MAGSHDRQQTRKALPQAQMSIDHGRFLARMGGGGDDDRASVDDVLDRRQIGGIGRRRRHVQLEIAGHAHARRAQLGIALGIMGGLGETEIEPLEQGGDRPGRLAPAGERALRQAAIDEHQRNAARRGLHNHVRPQVGFGDEREAGPPMVEEALDVPRRVERNELVDRPGGQAPLGELSRRHRSGRDEHVEAARANAVDQWDDRHHLADARAVRPDQRSMRPRSRAFAASLAHASGILPPAAGAVAEQQRGQRRRDGGQPPVGAVASPAGA